MPADSGKLIQCVTTGVIENKRLARQALCSAAAVVGGAVAAYAEQQGKHDLFDSVDFSAPDLLHQTEADCLTHCTDIFNAGTANLAALTAAITLFTARMNDPRGQIVNRSTLLKEVDTDTVGLMQQVADMDDLAAPICLVPGGLRVPIPGHPACSEEIFDPFRPVSQT